MPFSGGRSNGGKWLHQVVEVPNGFSVLPESNQVFSFDCHVSFGGDPGIAFRANPFTGFGGSGMSFVKNGELLKGMVFMKDSVPFLKVLEIKRHGKSEFTYVQGEQWIPFDGGESNGGKWLHEIVEELRDFGEVPLSNEVITFVCDASWSGDPGVSFRANPFTGFGGVGMTLVSNGEAVKGKMFVKSSMRFLKVSEIKRHGEAAFKAVTGEQWLPVDGDDSSSRPWLQRMR
eukprot:TRINITY_DN14907_c0_g1_i2.p1 TRINITY_DN14907_c0_g1~~TRINITY_DN14907_c0_g1_i2.p1  ORF type:complete len:231 (-),score=32.06 TRINITY_DN14907_c0_g1_i2:103-795(-)